MKAQTPVAPVDARAEDPRIARATRRPLRFLGLCLQLGLLLVVFRKYNVEEEVFLVMAATVFGAFGVHYWLPFRFKEPFWVAASIAGSYLLVHWVCATALLAVGLIFFGLFVAPLAFRTRALLAVALFGGLMYLRSLPPSPAMEEFCRDLGLEGTAWLGQLWPVFGGLFMFRLVIYLYDLRHMKARPSLREYLAYFFILPNYINLLFPVIDFQTMRKCYFRRDIHDVAQQGVLWMIRGTIQLLLYRVVYHHKPVTAPDEITSGSALLIAIVATYMLYLRVSGLFHLIIGMLHLFGYDLPETHRKYLLSRSLTDFWRRINIYWKDFMVKTVFFPVYFRLRRRGEMRAQVVATAAVFFVTWLTHSYQVFWLRGTFHVTWNDTLFWSFLGLVVIVNLYVEQRKGTRKKVESRPRWQTAVQVAATFSFISFLWFMWQQPTLGLWLDLLSWWKVG